MNLKLLLIFLVSILLIGYISKNRVNYAQKKGLNFKIVRVAKKEVLKSFKSRSLGNLLISYITGDKRRVSRKIKKIHSNLNLYHLFTPSGIHLASLYVFIFPLLYFLKRRSKKIYYITSGLIALSTFFLPGFYAIKRISLLRIMFLIKSYLKIDMDIFWIFIITFILDFFFGTFELSPMSFAYSFLFIGIIFSMKDAPRILLPFALLGGQITITLFQIQTLTMLGFIFGFIATAIFSFFFPLMFIYFLLSSFLPAFFGEFSVGLFFKMISLFSEISRVSGYYFGSFFMLVLIVVLITKLNLLLKTVLVVICLLLHSAPLINLPVKMFRGYLYRTDIVLDMNDLKNTKIKKVTTISKGLKVKFIDGSSCKFYIYNYFHVIKGCK